MLGHLIFYHRFFSILIAGCEYLPLTFSFQLADQNGIQLSLMTAYMEAADNTFRMIQQLFLGLPLAWYDWFAAALLAGFVLSQGLNIATKILLAQFTLTIGFFHYYYELASTKKRNSLRQEDKSTVPDPISDQIQIELPSTFLPTSELLRSDSSDYTFVMSSSSPKTIFLSKLLSMLHEELSNYSSSKLARLLSLVAIVIAGLVLTPLLGSYTGQAYTLATIATASKTFAWWVNQYPWLRDKSFMQKWLTGWSIAGFVEYLPLIGAFTIASEHGVHLGLITAYMEALDNAFRIGQQYMLGKPLYWYDYSAGLGMFSAVALQGILRGINV
jgi:hypothetical protein